MLFNNVGMLLFLTRWMDHPTSIAGFQLELYDFSSRDMINGVIIMIFKMK